MGKLGVRSLPLSGKRVLVRVDFNVPLDSHGAITDDTRLQASLPTLRYILEQGGKPILMSHLGRPKGKRDPQLTLRPCATRLAQLLGLKVIMAPDCVGPEVKSLIQELGPHEILLLENLRFHPGEEHPEREPDFVQQLAELGECYVNDAFGTAHRAHASTFFVPKLFPKQAAAGLLLEREIAYLGDKLLHPERPFVGVIGGSKVSSKLGVLKNLAEKADALLIGGAMAFTFLKARGYEVGKSLVESDLFDATRQLDESNAEIHLPTDMVIVRELNNESPTRTVSMQEGIPSDWIGVDIGPETLAQWKPLISQAKTIFWNGPLGVFEMPNFAQGTFQMAHLIADAQATTIVGGGDSVAAINQAGIAPAISHISTGGGATLEFIEQRSLPGLEALTEN